MPNINPKHQIRLIVGALRTGAIEQETAAAELAKLSSAELADALVDVVSRADGARALFCDAEGFVDGQSPGWFNVVTFSTKKRWDGPEAGDGGLEGFLSLDHAMEYAKGDAVKGAFAVAIYAAGDHKEYGHGEQMGVRFSDR